MAHPIDEHPAGQPAPTLSDLLQRHRPLVIRGACREWPMVAWANESDTRFAQQLAAHDNGAEVDALLLSPAAEGVIGYSEHFDAFNFSHHRISVTQGLHRLAQYSRQPQAPGLAIQSAPIASCLPGLLADHALAWLDPALQPRIWIGNQVTTPVHFDEYHNVACVVCGSRRFTLFAPEQTPDLYIGPLDFAPTGAAIGVARLDQPDDPRYPRLRRALQAALTAELRAGDAIYIPPMWWHHVESLARINALVNYWWKPVSAGGQTAESALGCLLHCILALRSLPPAERQAWRGLLDHYVFAQAQPLEHLPPDRRGILGELTPALREALRASIRRYL